MDSESYGVRRCDIDEKFADGEHCAICRTDEEELLEVAVIGEDECVLVCKVCLAKHGEELGEEVDEIERLDESDAGGEMDGDVE